VYDRPLSGRPYPDESGAARPMLHAVRLAFDHPITGERLMWDVPPPADFATLAERLELRRTERKTS
jgi:23S rRNA pseudouridine1911/1915/1917 synthase